MTMPTTNHNPVQWTDRQGQYLAFIYAYMTIHRQAPAERDTERFFRTSPPSVHNMLKALDAQPAKTTRTKIAVIRRKEIMQAHCNRRRRQ
ncbi:MAG: hypothetical protein V7642_2856 [Burkholderiales bacterium]